MAQEQKIRAILFYASVLVFVAGLPFILSSALGYRFDRRNFTFTRTGLISVKTAPQGARLYLDDRPLKERTPCTVGELMPGTYRIEAALDGYYPYTSEVAVKANSVTRLEKIILFPLRPDVDQLNKERLSNYWVDQQRGAIFYVDEGSDTVYRLGSWNERSGVFASFTPLTSPAKKWELSPDRAKLVYANARQIGIAFVRPDDQAAGVRTSFVLEYAGGAIQDVFWHSDSYYLVVVSDRSIDMLEARPGAEPVTLMKLSKKNSQPYYDVRSDELFFLDTEKGDDGRSYDNLYRLELRPKLPLFMNELMRKKTDEQR
jgi:hypothetical protein